VAACACPDRSQHCRMRAEGHRAGQPQGGCTLVVHRPWCTGRPSNMNLSRSPVGPSKGYKSVHPEAMASSVCTATAAAATYAARPSSGLVRRSVQGRLAIKGESSAREQPLRFYIKTQYESKSQGKSQTRIASTNPPKKESMQKNIRQVDIITCSE
jgi:hypothetical protein